MTSAAAAVAVALALGVGSDPYIRSRVDTGVAGDPAAHCLWWGATDVVFQQDSSGNPETTGTTELEAANRALASWAAVNAACGHLNLTEGERVPVRTIGFNQTGANQNTLLYRMKDCNDAAPKDDACWKDQSCMNKYDCWSGANNTIALTTTTYDTQTGEIYDADIEMNGAWFVFTTVDTPPCTYDKNAPDLGYNQFCVATDVQNTLTHELGHALGLDHTLYSGSTMNPSAPAGETSKRSIDSGSRQFICDAYPFGGPARDCVINAVKPTLGDTPGCAAAGGGAFPLLSGAWLWLRRRRGSSNG